MDNLDRFQKLISISILIGLDCRDPQAYLFIIEEVEVPYSVKSELCFYTKRKLRETVSTQTVEN